MILNAGNAIIQVSDSYKPLRLKALCAKYRIAQIDLARAVKQRGGRTLSGAAISQLINHSVYPRATPAFEVRAQIAELLTRWEVTPAEIDSAFEPDAVENAPIHVNMAHRSGLSVVSTKPVVPSSPKPFIDLPETEMLHEATLRYFNLPRDPFRNDVQNARDVFLTPDIRYVREAMWSAAKNQDFVAVIGESGSGKTVLYRDLIDRIQRENANVRIIAPQTVDKEKLTAAAIGQAILQDITPGAKVPSRLESQARHVREALLNGSKAGTSFLLAIEEAHDLNKYTLKQLKRFREIGDGFQQPLGIVLICQPEMRDMLDETKNYDAREVIRRISIVTLSPLDHNLKDYLAHKLARLDREVSKVFEDDAYDAIVNRLTLRVDGSEKAESHVYPLIVNNLVSKAMNEVTRLGAARVNASLIKLL